MTKHRSPIALVTETPSSADDPIVKPLLCLRCFPPPYAVSGRTLSRRVRRTGVRR